MIVTTEAIVLRRRKQGDTSKILTLYTKAFGKLNVIAKGAREVKSKFGASLETFTHATVVFYRKEHRDLHLLSKAETIESNSQISKSLEKIEQAMAIIELVDNPREVEAAEATKKRAKAASSKKKGSKKAARSEATENASNTDLSE